MIRIREPGPTHMCCSCSINEEPKWAPLQIESNEVQTLLMAFEGLGTLLGELMGLSNHLQLGLKP